MFNKHFLWLFQNVSILTEPGTNHDASLFLRASSLSCRTIFTGRNRRFPCCIRPDQNTPGQTKAPFSPRNAEKRVQVNAFAWPCQNRHSPVRSPQALSSEKLRSAVLSEVLDGYGPSERCRSSRCRTKTRPGPGRCRRSYASFSHTFCSRS